MNSGTRVPRLSVGVLSLLSAGLFGTAAKLLPWPLLSMFAVLLGVLAGLHTVTAVLCLLGSPLRANAFRSASLWSLGTFGYVSYGALGSGLYVHHLYAGVGTAIGLAALAAWAAFAFFFVPFSIWGVAATGGVLGHRPETAKRGARSLLLLMGLLVMFLLASTGHEARGERASWSQAELLTLAQREFAGVSPSSPQKVQTYERSPFRCAHDPATQRGETALLSFVGDSPERKTENVCLQAKDLEQLIAKAGQLLRERWVAGDALLEVASSRRALRDTNPLVDAVMLRPGTEAVCAGGACLSSWQLFGQDAFTEASNVSALQAKLGITAAAIRRHLGVEVGGYQGLTAFSIETLVLRGTEAPQLVRHLRGAPQPLSSAALQTAVDSAAGYILDNQEADGRYRYMVQPFTGEISFSGFSVPRQAGTTLALCEAQAKNARARMSARRSLSMLASLEQMHGDLGGIVYPKGSKRKAGLGNTALTSIALLACRPLTGNQHDATITRLTNTLLAMQRADGGFAPAFDPQTGQVDQGKDPLYAAGQAVFTLVLLEQAEGLPKPGGLKEAIDRAMNYYAGPYWDIPLRDFFYLEENWHCLAAQKALTSHRHDGYERFCIDYMTMKSRLIEPPTSGIDEDLVGSYAFGHVLPPHHAATAGFCEGLAASIALKQARKEDPSAEQETMRLALGYLLRHQWTEHNCSVCAKTVRVVGGFSEHVASPQIRIDFVQHAMAGIFHGGVGLGLLGG